MSCIERELRRRDVVAALGVTEKMLAAVGHPFHRTAKRSRSDRRQRIFAIGKQLGAETTADIGRHHPHLLRRNFQHRAAQHVAYDVAALAAERQREPVACWRRIRR